MKVLGFSEALENSGEIEINKTKVNIVIIEMLVALKLSSWSHGQGRSRDAGDIRLVLENIKKLCPDLSNDLHSDENTKLLEAYSEDESALWISIFGSRLKLMLNGSELYDYLNNLLSSSANLGGLIKDMNDGRVPDVKLEKHLRDLLLPFVKGATTL
jgi:hypothetical protein